jgi:hypothetical protein
MYCEPDVTRLPVDVVLALPALSAELQSFGVYA